MENQNNPTSDSVTPPVNTTSDQNPTPPVTPKKGLNWKGFLLALIIVGLLDWGALTVLHSENNQKLVPPTAPTVTPNPTANWKTFTSTHYPFTFKYPPTFQYKASFFPDTGLESDSLVITTETAKTIKGNHTPILLVNIYPRTSEVFEEAFNHVASNAARIEDENKTYVTIKKTTINGMSVQKLSWDTPLNGRKGYIMELLIKDTQGSVIINTYSGDTKFLTEDLVDQIVSTIKFTAPFPTAAPTQKALNPTPNPTEYFLQHK
jgi:hypothetical protein